MLLSSTLRPAYRAALAILWRAARLPLVAGYALGVALLIGAWR
jgi:hypothetical protein